MTGFSGAYRPPLNPEAYNEVFHRVDSEGALYSPKSDITRSSSVNTIQAGNFPLSLAERMADHHGIPVTHESVANLRIGGSRGNIADDTGDDANGKQTSLV